MNAVDERNLYSIQLYGLFKCTLYWPTNREQSFSLELFNKILIICCLSSYKSTSQISKMITKDYGGNGLKYVNLR